jgi:hypothetical protein
MEDAMKYRTRDGIPLAGDTAYEVIESLRRTSRDGRPTLRGFMSITARAAEIQTGQPVSGDTADALLAGLIGCGLIEEIE